jgi:hypothetical protein
MPMRGVSGRSKPVKVVFCTGILRLRELMEVILF